MFRRISCLILPCSQLTASALAEESSSLSDDAASEFRHARMTAPHIVFNNSTPELRLTKDGELFWNKDGRFELVESKAEQTKALRVIHEALDMRSIFARQGAEKRQ